MEDDKPEEPLCGRSRICMATQPHCAVTQSRHFRPPQIVPRPFLAGSRVFEIPMRVITMHKSAKPA